MNRGGRHFPGAVSTPHHAPSGEPSVALVAQKTRCGRAGGAGLYHCPTCRTNTRRAGRRVGTLTHLYRHASRTAHDGHTSDIAVPPTRRGERRGPYRRPVCRTGPAGERRVGTLTRPYRHDGHTVRHGATRAIAVPPTRRGRRGECREAARATPNSRRRRHAASQSPDGRALPSRDRRRRRRRPTRHAGHVSPGQTTDAGLPRGPTSHANHAYPLTYPRAPGSAPPNSGATTPGPT